MTQSSYKQFCPVAMACEIIEPRWTLLIMCEMSSGSTRFNEIRRGVPAMSPTLLSKRLKEMEVRELITRDTNPKTGNIDYRIAPKGEELLPIIFALGQWAHRNVDSDVTLENLDARLLMWNIKRNVDTRVLPAEKRTTIQFIFPELEKGQKNYWLTSKPGSETDICWSDPGFDVDLFVTSDLKALTSAWIGLSKLESEISADRINLIGDKFLVNNIGTWMRQSAFSPHRRA